MPGLSQSNVCKESIKFFKDLILIRALVRLGVETFCTKWFMKFRVVHEIIEGMGFLVKLTNTPFLFIKMANGVKITTNNARDVFLKGKLVG